MSAKLFGFGIWLSGIIIATYYTVWVVLQTPMMTERR
jgi:hypothetical protein